MNIYATIIWVNENQGVVAIGIFMLGVIGFFIRKLLFPETTRTYMQKQKSGDNSVNIQSGKDINYESE